MKESSRMPLFDLRKLNASLPVPKMTNCSTDLLVLGAKDDFIVVIPISTLIYALLRLHHAFFSYLIPKAENI